VKYIVFAYTFFFIISVLTLYSCENVRHKIGITTKPFSKNDGFENSTKLNYSIIFGKVRIRKSDGTENED